MELDETRALVIGASSGIGKAIAEAFAGAGAAVIVSARSEDRLETVAEGLEGDSAAIPCDVSDPDSVDRCVTKAIETLGGLDTVVVSAGTMTRGPIHETAEEDLERVIDVNLAGSMRVARAVLPELVDTAGSLLFISSETAQRGIPDLPVYSATKGGQNALTRQLAIQYAADGVRVNAIAPGTTKTRINEAVRQNDPTWVPEREAKIPLGRLGEVEDMTGIALLLASDRGEYITGQVFGVDGGTTAE